MVKEKAGVDSRIFEPYLSLRSLADRIFEEVRHRYPDRVRCRVGCDDCCFAVFQLTLVESAYLHTAFHLKLSRAEKRAAVRRARKSERILEQLAGRIRSEASSREDVRRILGRARVECPLHQGDRCLLHPDRPITCRLYGIPAAIGGTSVTCGKSGFTPGESYPTVDLDRFHGKLLALSRDLILNGAHPELADRTWFVSRIVQMPEEGDWFRSPP